MCAECGEAQLHVECAHVCMCACVRVCVLQGVIACLSESGVLHATRTPVGGSSAGAIAAGTVASGVSVDEAMRGVVQCSVV